MRVEHVSLDVITFLEAAAAGVALASRGNWTAAESQLRQAERLYVGDFLEEDPYEDWPAGCREEARSAAQEVSRLLARLAVGRDDDEQATRHLRRLLERDQYDADAWTAPARRTAAAPSIRRGAPAAHDLRPAHGRALDPAGLARRNDRRQTLSLS